MKPIPSLKFSGFYNETFRTKLVYDNNNRLLDLKIFSLNPSALLDQSLNLGGSSVLFSATLSPLEYYQEMLGGFDSLIYSLPSPFDSNHLKVLIDDKTQVTYRKREENLPTIVSKLKVMVEVRRLASPIRNPAKLEVGITTISVSPRS